MINFGRVTTQTRGPILDFTYYEKLNNCAPGGPNIRVGSPCDL